MSTIDFDGLNARLSLQIRSLLPMWLPGGKIIGDEYMVGSLLGGAGDSLRFNIKKCIGSDFATGDKFGDCVSLYASIYGLSQGDAAKQLLQAFPPIPNVETPKQNQIQTTIHQITPAKPPENSAPSFKHFKFGEPSMVWPYRDEHGDIIFFMARYETEAGKQFTPWSYFSDGKWRAKAQEIPRPIYNLHEIYTRPSDPVLIVEGEKAADAAHKIAGHVYCVTTWPSGTNAYKVSNWSHIKGRAVLLWPDADLHKNKLTGELLPYEEQPGVKAMNGLAKILSDHCPEIKIIDVSSEKSIDGFDAADSNFDWEQFKQWAKPKISIYNHMSVQAEVMPNKTKPDASKPSDVDIIDGSLYAIWEKIGISQSANGQPICNLDNALRVLEGLPAFTDIIWFDEFHQKYFTTWQSSTKREWNDVDDLRLCTFMQRNLGLRRISDDMINKAIRVHGRNNTKNEPKDWMESLEWDGTPRIDTFLIDCAGAQNNEYVRCASRNFWLTMVARIFKAGCQVDNMIVLEGSQGKGKTSLLRAIGGQWYGSAKEKVDSNNFFMMLEGKLLLEIAELDSFNRAEITRIKQVVSDPVDRYRSPYERSTEDHPRQSVFVGTTNEQAYLRDETGGRRFWPVKCGEINLTLTLKHRNQLFAEAVSIYKSEEHLPDSERILSAWWRMPESAAIEQEERRQIDPWEDKIHRFILSKYETTTADIMDSCIRIEASKQSRFDEIRIGKILLKIGWNRVRRTRDGIFKWIYISPNHDNERLNEQL